VSATGKHDIVAVRVQLLEQLNRSDQTWGRVAAKYGVSNDIPPWKSSLDGICDALDHSPSAALPLVARRREEDLLTRALYRRLPYPESQLVALAHSLVARGVISEDELMRRMHMVRERLARG
jgi:hypothetical protein